MRSYLRQLWESLDAIPRVSIVQAPTPVRRLEGLNPGGELWVKDDSQTHPLCGGNKPRKLEYLIASAKARRKGIVTFGAESSNHAVASVYHCGQHGVRCHVVLTRA